MVISHRQRKQAHVSSHLGLLFLGSNLIDLTIGLVLLASQGVYSTMTPRCGKSSFGRAPIREPTQHALGRSVSVGRSYM